MKKYSRQGNDKKVNNVVVLEKDMKYVKDTSLHSWSKSVFRKHYLSFRRNHMIDFCRLTCDGNLANGCNLVHKTLLPYETHHREISGCFTLIGYNESILIKSKTWKLFINVGRELFQCGINSSFRQDVLTNLVKVHFPDETGLTMQYSRSIHDTQRHEYFCLHHWVCQQCQQMILL